MRCIIFFTFEAELVKLKISIPSSEFLKNEQYRVQIIKAFKIEKNYDTVNVTDDHPTISFGPNIEDKIQDGEVPPFYVSLNIHDVILNNSMLDFGASHNLMLKVIMESLGLDVTIPYKDLYSFNLFIGKISSVNIRGDHRVGNLKQLLFR